MASSIDSTTLVSLLFASSLLAAAYGASLRFLSSRTSPTLRVLYIWHVYNSLTHFIFEGSWLYLCFFASAPAHHTKQLTATSPAFLNDPLHNYGPKYATGPFAALWMEYAKADSRWAVSDPTVISLELLTVLIGGPLAAYICLLIQRKQLGSAAFWMVVLGTAEIYGGWMTFAPEWLTGSYNLDTQDPMHLWVYLVFFNGLWVVFPLWAVAWSYGQMKVAFEVKARVDGESKGN
jgi:EXPERA (EXPanded EBP superfamily)